jgi:hypothetical protein
MVKEMQARWWHACLFGYGVPACWPAASALAAFAASDSPSKTCVEPFAHRFLCYLFLKASHKKLRWGSFL